MCAAEAFRVVPRYDYRQQLGDIDGLLSNLKSMLIEGNYILGPEVSEFEAAFAAYCDCFYCKGVNTGTDALIIALLASGIGPGDEVIVPANTFHATVAAVEISGAIPVLVDAEDSTYLLDIPQLSSAASERTKAIIPVHLYGKPVQMPKLLDFASRKGLVTIEDAAQAHGASLGGKRVGSFGALGCFSFHPSKNLAAAGDAGAIVTQDDGLARKAELYRALGQQSQNEHVVVGLNSKMDTLQARILSWKLQHLDEWNRSRAEIAGWYRSELDTVPLSFQATSPDEVHVYHLFPIRTTYRNSLLKFLRSRGIDAVIRYPTPIHLQPAFERHKWRQGQFPVAERLAEELLCLPIRPAMTQAEVCFVIEGVREFFAQISSAAKEN